MSTKIVTMPLQEELNQIVSEYKAYFPMFILMEKQKGESEISHIKLKTLEGLTISTSVTERGWFLLGTDKHYDTFEALMNSHSPGFRDTFARNVFEKLQKLAEE